MRGLLPLIGLLVPAPLLWQHTLLPAALHWCSSISCKLARPPLQPDTRQLIPARPPRTPAGSLRKQRGAAGEYTRDLEQLTARHSAAVHSALARAECAEHEKQELRWQLAQQRNSARIDCEALRQHAALAAVREGLALPRAERAQRELAVLKGELRQLRGECGNGRTSGSEAAVAAVEAVPQPGTAPTVVVRGTALKSALKRPGPQEKKKKKVRSACGVLGALLLSGWWRQWAVESAHLGTSHDLCSACVPASLLSLLC